MAQLVVTNVSSEDLPIADLYRTLAPGESITTTRNGSDFPRMRSLQAALAAGSVTVSITPDTTETLSGLLTPPVAVEAADIATVSGTASLGGMVVVRKAFAAGGGGGADDVTVVSLGGLSTALRVVDAVAYVSTAVGASTLAVYTEAAGAGTLLATLDSGTTGRKVDTTATASAVAPTGATSGIFVRRSDSGVAGEVVLICRPEA